MSNVTLKAMADTNPTDWKTPIYTQFGMIGASIIIFVFLPESACTLPYLPSTLKVESLVLTGISQGGLWARAGMNKLEKSWYRSTRT